MEQQIVLLMNEAEAAILRGALLVNQFIMLTEQQSRNHSPHNKGSKQESSMASYNKPCLQQKLLEIGAWTAISILIYNTKSRFMLSQNRGIITSLHIQVDLIIIYMYF